MLDYIAYAICRIEFVLENWKAFSNTLFQNTWADLLNGSWMFDTSAILYTNSLYALMMLFPFTIASRPTWQTIAKWIFIATNTVCITSNIIDSVYFQYTGRRTTISVLQEFSNESNLGSIFFTEILQHWYLTIFVLLLSFLLYLFYATPKWKVELNNLIHKIYFYVFTSSFLSFYILLSICGMRGGITTAVRPITISNANQYVNHPQEAAVILNTPFSIIRTIGKETFQIPNYFPSEDVEKIYTPLHRGSKRRNEKVDSAATNHPSNIVVLIVESFGREYIGAYNERLENGHYQGYTPFIDSLYQKCLSFDYTFANGRKSIDGMPSILSSIPMFVEPFFLTPASLNNISGLAGELGKIGYQSAFFHGAENGSMGFQAFARATGFQKYYGRTEYNADSRFNGDKDFDGTWAIWDEPFLQYYALKMSEIKEPFITALFTASSHHPFAIPKEYETVFKEDKKNPIHKCIRYTDYALRRFFDTASRQPWYEHTLFVITSDHTNISDHAEYQTDLGVFGAPILFFDPSGKLSPQRRHAIAQQIDIMPTVLSYLDYEQPYIAFGSDLLTTPDSMTWAVNYLNGIYQYVKYGHVLQFNGEKTTAVYSLEDRLMKNNIAGQIPQQSQMERELKAIIQQYMERLTNNRLIP